MMPVIVSQHDALYVWCGHARITVAVIVVVVVWYL
jgi:hypothetical protein